MVQNLRTEPSNGHRGAEYQHALCQRSPGQCCILGAAVQSYDVEHSTLPDRIINEEPFCEQYFNSRNMPWGFHSANVAGHPAGYPIWLDVNLSHHELLRWLQYLDDGLFFDSATETVSIELITYNANLQLFSKSTLLLLSENGGAYHVHSSVDTIKVRSASLSCAAPLSFTRSWWTGAELEVL